MAEGRLQPAVVDQLDRTEFHAALADEPDGTRWIETGWDVGGDADALWPWILEPALLRRWSPMVPDHTLDAPGPTRVRENDADEPITAEVVEVDPGRRRIELRAGGSTLRWWVRGVGDGLANVELRQSVAGPQGAAATAAGWAICLSVLAAIHEGHDVERVVGTDALPYGWEPIRDEYARNFDEV
ncbi:MAG: SRPBCC family protein [Actinomycetales bacterium]